VSWLGAWLGGSEVVAGEDDDDEDGDDLTPIEAPFDEADEEYVDHVEEAVERLPYYLARLG
jgi:hypothetical protein